MIFNSTQFLFFIALVFTTYLLSPSKFRVWILLVSSYIFYAAWNPFYILLIILSTGIDFCTGLALDKTDKHSKRKKILALSIVFNLGTLFIFKYFNFFIDNLNEVFFSGQEDPKFANLSFILPVGISFYTFQSMSYSIDVYKSKYKAERKLHEFALYISYFPQLVAGPIERFPHLSEQIKKLSLPEPRDLSRAFRLILYGFFLKMVVADNIGTYVDSIYKNIEESNSWDLIYAALLYSFQIYGDFHGYTTIAIGCAGLFGIHLSKNFNSPYFSQSLTTFWRKWHISLTNWFREYVYYPLGGSYSSKLKSAVAILIVFIISGLWHGAAWTFVIWGILHGAITILEKSLKLDKDSKSLPLAIFRTAFIFVLVSFLWIFFRSSDFDTALFFVKSIVNNLGLNPRLLDYKLLCIVLPFLILEFLMRKTDFDGFLEKSNPAIKYSICFMLLFGILVLSSANTQPFIYFQF